MSLNRDDVGFFCRTFFITFVCTLALIGCSAAPDPEAEALKEVTSELKRTNQLTEQLRGDLANGKTENRAAERTENQKAVADGDVIVFREDKAPDGAQVEWIMTDRQTGCEYIFLKYGNDLLVPRMNSDGKQVCKKIEVSSVK